MGGACSTFVYRLLVGRHKGRELPGRRKLRRENNIKIDLQEMGWEKWT
jgi:hypothetical protein